MDGAQEVEKESLLPLLLIVTCLAGRLFWLWMRVAQAKWEAKHGLSLWDINVTPTGWPYSSQQFYINGGLSLGRALQLGSAVWLLYIRGCVPPQLEMEEAFSH